MAEIRNTQTFMRVTHRYLGFFMVGIMAMYAISGILLVFRDTGFLKKEKQIDKVIATNITEKDLGKELKLKDLKILKTENGVLTFKEGTYNSATGQAKYAKKELPFVLDKMTKLHKSPSKDKLGGLNVLFGICLLFFVISSFWMFNYRSKIFKRGIMIAVAGLLVSIFLILM